jgi:hypothetical protein
MNKHNWLFSVLEQQTKVQGAGSSQDETSNLFADDKVCKLLADITPQKSHESKEIVLMRKNPDSGSTAPYKPKLGSKIVKQGCQKSDKTISKIFSN